MIISNEKAIEVLKTYDFSDDNTDEEFKDALRTAIWSLNRPLNIKTEVQRLNSEKENSDLDNDTHDAFIGGALIAYTNVIDYLDNHMEETPCLKCSVKDEQGCNGCCGIPKKST